MTILAWDASTPPLTWPTGFLVGCGYIGGDTPHVWTNAEWQRYGKRKKLAIWTQNFPNASNAEAEAHDALKRCKEIGYPKGMPIIWDAEGAINVAYSNLFHAVVHAAGYRMWTYGQSSDVFDNPQHEGYWPAQWPFKPPAPPFMHPHKGVRMTQYANDKLLGKPYDASTVKWYQYHRVIKAW